MPLKSRLGVALLLFLQVQDNGLSSLPIHEPLGAPAPDFQLPGVRGGSYRLSELRGHAVLLSFLSTQETVSKAPGRSRSQLVSLKSMDDQYKSKGLRIVIVAASLPRAGREPDYDSLLNFTYDWNLTTIPLLVDRPRGEIARMYRVRRIPTTFLIDANGIVRERWNGFATAGQLALALQSLIQHRQ